MSRSVRQTVVLAKLETTAGVDAAPTGADNAVLVREPSITPLEAAQVDRALTRPHFGASEQLQGAAVVRVSFTVELVGSGVGGVAPAWGPLLQACAFAPATGLSGAVRVEYQPVTEEPKTVTIYYADSGVVHKLLGAMGTFALEALVDGIPVLKFDFVGLDGGIAAQAMPAAVYTAWQRPPVVGPATAIDVTLGCTYSAGALVGGTQYTSTGLTLDAGNAPGLTSFVSSRRIDNTNREVVGKTELALSAAQEVALMEVAKTNTTTSLGFAVGLTPQLRVTVFAQAVQLLNPSKADRNGVRTVGFDLRLLPVAGNDELLLATSVDEVPPAPTLASLEPYRTSATTFKAVPWGPVTWTEGAYTYSQVVDIYLPSGAPTGPFVVRDHAAQSPYDITAGSTLDTTVVQAALAKGYVVFARAARHPKLSSTPTEFFDSDYGRSLQFIRSLHVALGFDPTKGYCHTQSRGSGMMIQQLLPDLANPVASTYAGRMSSRGLKLIYSINPQAFNRSLTMAQAYLTNQTEIDLALADYPDDARQRDAATLVATADAAAVPLFVAKYDATFQSGLVTYAAMQAAGGVLHYPNQGLTYRTAYAARGMLDRIIVTDQDAGLANVTADFVPVIASLEAGLNLAQAMAVARAARLGHSLIYIPPTLAGVTLNMDGSGGTPAVGGNIGGISDKSAGLANTSSTNGAGQPTNANKPKLAALGAQYGALFADSTDALICQRANTGAAGCMVAWTTTARNFTVNNQTTAQINWTVGAGNTQTLAVVGGAPLSKADERTYVTLASQVAGSDLFATVV